MNILENETFTVGCNYWASDSGVYMWRNWNEENVDNDFRLLSEIGVKIIRVFPLWCDFQPIKKMYIYRQNLGGLSVDDGRNMLTNFDDGSFTKRLTSSDHGCGSLACRQKELP